MLSESPTTYPAGFSQNTGSSNLRRRTTQTSPKVTSAERSQPADNFEHLVDRSFAKAVRRSVVHIVPVLISGTLLALSAGKVYFGDLNGPAWEWFALQAFQYAAKAHDLLMTVSIADIVLHRIRWDLIVANGVPFGLLSSAYQLSDLGYFFSDEFVACAWVPWSHDRRRRTSARLSMSLLLMLACVLTLTVGPSSGVMMIPRLDWWHVSRPYGQTTLRLFIENGSQASTWPSTYLIPS